MCSDRKSETERLVKSSVTALRKALNALDPQAQYDSTNSAINVLPTHDAARLEWNDWAIVLTEGSEDRTIAEDMDYATAVGVAHALDAVYGYRVYDAVAAMLTGATYSHMHALALTFRGYEGKDFETGGVTHYEVDRLLAHHGCFIQRRFIAYDEFGPWPPAPWEGLHYASVVQPSNRDHFVVMDGQGVVLDPLRQGSYRLTDWSKVNQVVAVRRPSIPGEPNPQRSEA